MGHASAKPEVLALQRRLDRMPIGAPAHRALFEVLETLYSPEECRLAAAMPLRPSSLRRISRAAGMTLDTTRGLLEGLCFKGLVLDMPRSGKEALYVLTPVLGGFFEFTLMRTHIDGVDLPRVARLMKEYVEEDPEHAFYTMMARGETFIGRPLVHEDELSPALETEILDFEKASQLIEGATALAESVCYCRHIAEHTGNRCRHPSDHCLTLGHTAEYVVRQGMGKPIDKTRAREVLAYAREHDLVQMADNVQRQPAFICNCCKCCCEMLGALRSVPDQRKTVTSGFSAQVLSDRCNGCGLCQKVCPVNVVDLLPAGPTLKVKNRKQMAVIDPRVCIGCGVCLRHCKPKAIELKRTPKRVVVPANFLDRSLRQAIEHGTLQHLLFDDPSRFSHRVMAGALGALLRLPLSQRLLAREQVKSKAIQLVLGWTKTATPAR